MAEARDVGRAIGTHGVPNRHFDDFERKFRRAEDEVEIAERIKIAEIIVALGDAVIMLPPQRLGAAQRIGEALIEQPGEQQREKR